MKKMFLNDPAFAGILTVFFLVSGLAYAGQETIQKPVLKDSIKKTIEENVLYFDSSLK